MDYKKYSYTNAIAEQTLEKSETGDYIFSEKINYFIDQKSYTDLVTDLNNQKASLESYDVTTEIAKVDAQLTVTSDAETGKADLKAAIDSIIVDGSETVK